MKKYIANIITGSRVIFSLSILLTSLSSVWFYLLYLFCGITDMIDGTIARKTGTVSKFGARLDTAANFVFMVVCSIKILPQIDIPVCLWVWIILVAMIKIFNIAFVFIRNRKIISIHSVLNKTTGFVLFIFPLSLVFVESTYIVAAICVLATFAAIQESYFIVKKQAHL